VALEPSYGEGVEGDLDRIMDDPGKDKLYGRIVETLNLICDEPDSSTARRHVLQHPDGPIWRVPVRGTGEDQDYVVLWATNGQLARFLYVGVWPPE
jgi:hypothetical protein